MEITKSILIIKSQPKALQAVETFLRNREWVLYSTTNIKDALTYLIQRKPSFVMVAVDHPVKKVRTLPRVLGQAFPVCVIAFAEQATSHTFKMLLDSGTEYRVNPPATGPAVERTVNKFIKDQQALHQQQIERNQNLDSQKKGFNQGTIVMKGNADLRPQSFNIPVSGNNPSGNAPENEDEDLDLSSIIKQISENQKQAAAIATGGTAPSEAPNITQTNPQAVNLGNIQQSGPGSGNIPQGGSGEKAPTLMGPVTQESAPKGPAVLASMPEAPQAPPAAPSLGSFAQPNPSAQNSDEPPKPAVLGTIAPTPVPTREQPVAPTLMSTPDQNSGQYPTEAPVLAATPDSSQNPQKAAPLLENMPNTSNEPAAQGSQAGSVESEKAPRSLGGPNQGFVPRYSEDDIEEKPSKPAPELKWGPVDVEKKENNKKDMGVEPTPDQRIPKHDEKKALIRESLNQAVRKIGGSSGWDKTDSIMGRAAQKALDESVENRDLPVKEKIENSSNVACIVVESPRFAGYLVAAMGNNRKIDEKFILAIKDRLFKFLKDNGEDMKDENGLDIKIRQVDFEDWALEYADFLRKSVHNGDEVAMAFFPFTNAGTKIGESASAEMGSVKLDDLQGDLHVEFNLYIYLPANNRYVLYTPRGSKFYGNQKDRLGKMGVTHLHMRKSEAQDLSKYRAQNYLNSKIEEYHRLKANKKKSVS